MVTKWITIPFIGFLVANMVHGYYTLWQMAKVFSN